MIKKFILPSFILALSAFISALFKPPFASDYHYINWILFAVSFAIMFLLIKRYKEIYSNGVINFKQAFGYGFKISLCYTVLLAIAYFTYFKLNEQDCLKNINAVVELTKQNNIETSGTPSAKQEKTMNMVFRFISNPYVSTISAFLNNLFWGVVYSLISAGIIKTKEKNQVE